MLIRQWVMFLVSTFLLILPLYGDRRTIFKLPFSCFKCTHHDKPQEIKEAACVKKFDPSKYTHEDCQSEYGSGKCLKAYEKIEARTKKQIEDDERTVTTRKCVSRGELDYLENVQNIDTTDGCHTIRSTKTKHKVYCFCSTNLCNNGKKIIEYSYLVLFFVLLLFSTRTKIS